MASRHANCPGAWGELPTHLPQAIIKSAQELIRQFKEKQDGKASV